MLPHESFAGANGSGPLSRPMQSPCMARAIRSACGSAPVTRHAWLHGPRQCPGVLAAPAHGCSSASLRAMRRAGRALSASAFGSGSARPGTPSCAPLARLRCPLGFRLAGLLAPRAGLPAFARSCCAGVVPRPCAPPLRSARVCRQGRASLRAGRRRARSQRCGGARTYLVQIVIKA